MTQTPPLRFRRLGPDTLLFGSEAGHSFLGDNQFLARFASGGLTDADSIFLADQGLLFDEGSLGETAYLYSLAQRFRRPQPLAYVLLVPTLRCDLACTYCQVSRVSEGASGFDWTPETLDSVLRLLDSASGEDIQIEFQGGEPTLRLDLVSAVIAFCRSRFARPRFVICTNLSRVSDELLVLTRSPDVYISTSFDGTLLLHQKRRTKTTGATQAFLDNLKTVQAEAPGRVDALPTLDPSDLPEPDELLDGFSDLGMRSIYLRPIVFHGFARKHHHMSASYDPRWKRFHEAVIRRMIARNAHGGEQAFYEDYSMSLAMKRLLRPGEDGHVDLRSPQWLGYDHLVIDFDGKLYPTDEARMLARSRIADLSIGRVAEGINTETRRQMQAGAINALDPWCSECPYQAACGADPIDAVARLGRIDAPTPHGFFCQKQTHIFDLAVELLASDDPVVQKSVAAWLKLPAPVALMSRAP